MTIHTTTATAATAAAAAAEATTTTTTTKTKKNKNNNNSNNNNKNNKNNNNSNNNNKTSLTWWIRWKCTAPARPHSPTWLAEWAPRETRILWRRRRRCRLCNRGCSGPETAQTFVQHTFGNNTTKALREPSHIRTVSSTYVPVTGCGLALECRHPRGILVVLSSVLNLLAEQGFP